MGGGGGKVGDRRGVWERIVSILFSFNIITGFGLVPLSSPPLIALISIPPASFPSPSPSFLHPLTLIIPRGPQQKIPSKLTIPDQLHPTIIEVPIGDSIRVLRIILHQHIPQLPVIILLDVLVYTIGGVVVAGLVAGGDGGEHHLLVGGGAGGQQGRREGGVAGL